MSAPRKFCSPLRWWSRSGVNIPEFLLVLALIVFTSGAIWFWECGLQFGQGQPASSWSERGDRAPLYSVVITPDQQHILTVGADETLRTHSLASQESLSEQQIEQGSSRCLICSPAGRQLVIGTFTGHIQIWDFHSKGIEPRTIRGHQSQVLCGAFHPGGKFFVTCDEDRNCIAWSTRELSPIWTVRNSTGAISTLSFTQDGQRLISGDLRGYVKTWDSFTGKMLSACGVNNAQSALLGKIVGVHSIPNTDDVIVVGMTGPIEVWDLKAQLCKRRFEMQRCANQCLALSPDGKSLLSGATDGSISVWDVTSAKRLKTWPAHASAVLNLAFAVDGSRFVSVGWDGRMRVWTL